MCGFSNELGVNGVSTFPDIGSLVEPSVCGGNDMPFVFLAVTMMAFRWTPVRVPWAIGKSQLLHIPECKNAGLMVVCYPSVKFHVVYFY